MFIHFQLMYNLQMKVRLLESGSDACVLVVYKIVLVCRIWKACWQHKSLHLNLLVWLISSIFYWRRSVFLESAFSTLWLWDAGIVLICSQWTWDLCFKLFLFMISRSACMFRSLSLYAFHKNYKQEREKIHLNDQELWA